MTRVSLIVLVLSFCAVLSQLAFTQERSSELFAPVTKLAIGDAVVIEAADKLAEACAKLLQTPSTEGNFVVVLEGQVTKFDSAANEVTVKARQDYPYFGADRKSADETRLLQMTLTLNLKDFRIAKNVIATPTADRAFSPNRIMNLPTARYSTTKGAKLQSWAIVEEINGQ